jgi:hypothetical protein
MLPLFENEYHQTEYREQDCDTGLQFGFCLDSSDIASPVSRLQRRTVVQQPSELLRRNVHFNGRACAQIWGSIGANGSLI